MTPASDRRRRATRVGAIATGVAFAVVIAATASGASVLYNSTQGKNAAGDRFELRPMPQTPNLLLGVASDGDELASAVVLTLSPSGQGGSVVTLPLDAAGARPTESIEAITIADAFDEGRESFGFAATSVLGVSFDQVAVVSRSELEQLLEPVGSVQVDLPADVVADADGTPNIVTERGPALLETGSLAEALAAVWAGDDAELEELGLALPVADENTEALWDGIAGGIGGGLDTGAPASIDVPPGTDRFLDRLLNGPLSVRRLASRSIESDDGQRISLISRTDVILVFGQVSPRKVAPSLDSISVRVVVGFNDEDVSNAQVASLMIDRLTFGRINVVSVSTAVRQDGAPDVTQVQIINPIVNTDGFDGVLGEFEEVTSQYDIPGVDAVITVGESTRAFYDES
ncbi:hypothetical protein BH24ACT6_BH24ACT6_02600 [soil metagenome]